MDSNDKKVINWNELSVVLTGEAGVVRSNFVQKEHKKEVEKLMNYISKWCEKNRKTSAIIPRVSVKIGNTVTTVKKPKQIEPFVKIEALPGNCEKISNGLYKKGNCFYTNRFSMSHGLDIREWYSLEPAKSYLVSKLKENV